MLQSLTNNSKTINQQLKPPFINSGSVGKIEPKSYLTLPTTSTFRSPSLPDIHSPTINNNNTATMNNQNTATSLSNSSLLFDNINVNDLLSSTPMLQNNVVKQPNNSLPSSGTSTPLPNSSSSSISSQTPNISSPPSIVTSSNNNGMKATTQTSSNQSMNSTSTPVGINTSNITHGSNSNNIVSPQDRTAPQLTRASSSLSISKETPIIGTGFSVGAAAALSPSLRRVYPTVADQYKLLEPIGFGASGPVYEAICIPFNEPVAIKKLDLERLEDNVLQTITKEIHTMVTSFHEHIVNYLTSFTHETELYLVMELMEAGSIYDIMRYRYTDGLTSEELISVILYQVLEGLAYFHENGQIHRDIKASNILINEDGLVRIGDFGVSANIIEMSGDRRSKRQTFVGSPCWMAPEVMEQFHGYDCKADIWSFGITAIELAQGRAPYEGLPPVKVMYIVMEQDPPQLVDTESRKFSKIFKDMISLCLQKDPLKRPSASQLLKHKFFAKANKQKDLIKKVILNGLPSLSDRAKHLGGLRKSNSQTKITFTMTQQESPAFISMQDTPSLMSTTMSTSGQDTSDSEYSSVRLLTDDNVLNSPLTLEVEPQPEKKGVSRWNFDEILKEGDNPTTTKKVEKKGRFEVTETDEDSVEKITNESPSHEQIVESKKVKKRNFEVKEVDEIPEEAVTPTGSTAPKKKVSISSTVSKEVSMSSLSNQIANLQSLQQVMFTLLSEKTKPQNDTVSPLDLISKLEQKVQDLMEENQKLKRENEQLRTSQKNK